MNPLDLISKIFGVAVHLREFLYSKNILASYDVGVPVVSVGNLTFGGTGKTPTCDFLIEHLKTSKKIAILSRGYGRKTKGFLKVDSHEQNAAQKFGDEPTWLAKKHPEVGVYVCEDRVQGCKKILDEKKVDLIIADDAFQHLRLKREFDILVIDATEDLKNYSYPPVGRARNSWKYLKRADAIFLTKVNLGNTQTLRALNEKMVGLPTFKFNMQIRDFIQIHSNKKLDRTPQEVFLLSGIGKPWTFETLVKNDFSFFIKKHFEFKDHFAYSQKTLKNIEAQVGKKPLLVTQKDAIKLKNLKTSINIYESQLVMTPISEMEKFYELLGQ